MYEGAGLARLCGLPSEEALGAALFPGAGIASSAAIQRRVEEDLLAEVTALAGALEAGRAAFMRWLAARLQAENLKAAARRIFSGAPAEAALGLFAGPPAAAGPYGPGLEKAKDAAGLLAALPAGPLRGALESGYAAYGSGGNLFFLEAAVDRGYLTELLGRAAGLPAAGREAALALAAQEADIFHLALVSRGKLYYGFETENLLALHIPGTRLDRRRLRRMLTSAPEAARELAAGLAVERAGINGPGLEKEGWLRYARLANRIFRGANVDFGAAAGYAALRRLEAVNLAVVAEGLRLGVPEAELRARLVNTLAGEENVQAG